MNKSNGVEGSPKVGDPVKVLTEKDVRALVKRDLEACIIMLQTVHDDVDVFEMLCTALYGKYMNARHLTELQKQTQIVP